MTSPPSNPRRGDIYYVDFNPSRGSEQAGRRPAVVISLDSFNSRMPVVVVAAITSQVKPAMSVTVILPEGKPLPKRSQILAFQVLSVDKSRLSNCVGRLDANQLADLEKALRLAWGL